MKLKEKRGKKGKRKRGKEKTGKWGKKREKTKEEILKCTIRRYYLRQ